jgi:hypothetical protein
MGDAEAAPFCRHGACKGRSEDIVDLARCDNPARIASRVFTIDPRIMESRLEIPAKDDD